MLRIVETIGTLWGYKCVVCEANGMKFKHYKKNIFKELQGSNYWIGFNDDIDKDKYTLILPIKPENGNMSDINEENFNTLEEMYHKALREKKLERICQVILK